MGLVRIAWRRAIELMPHTYRLTGIGGTTLTGRAPILQADLLFEPPA